MLIFTCITLPFLIILAIMTPPGEVPDEPAHLARADSLRTGQLVGRRARPEDAWSRSVPSAGVSAHSGLIAAAFFMQPSATTVDRPALEREAALGWGQRIYIHAPNTVVYGPTFYIPTALTLEITQRLHISPYYAILTARLVNAALYIALGAAALGIARRGKLIILFVLALPMSISLAASLNQDGLLIASGALIAALLTRIKPSIPSPTVTWSAAFLITALIMAKPVYLPLAATLLLPTATFMRCASGTGWRLSDHRVALGALSMVVVFAVAWTAYNAVFVAVPFEMPSYEAGPLANSPMVLLTTDPGLQLKILLADPTRFVSIPFRTILWEGELWWMQLVGVLGTNDLLFPKSFYRIWFAIACLTLAASVALGSWKRPGLLPLLDRAILGLIGLICLWLILVGQYLSWTYVGQPLVTGIQGRYFLPIFPFLALALPEPALSRSWFETIIGLAWTTIILFSGTASITLILSAYYIA
jgi:uncharacterized membrane protein